jgi:putative RNA 2'-phosphotransferase
MNNNLKHISKLISLVLRHKPEEINLQLNENGWANVQELISKINSKGIKIDEELLHTIVDTNDKKRFAFNDDKTLIRANQGHSIEVDVELKPTTPPEILYHGTAQKYVDSILQSGIQKKSRQHVHLSTTIQTAIAVGSRHGKPVILQVQAQRMYEDGFVFYLSANNVWLVNDVPVRFIEETPRT